MKTRIAFLLAALVLAGCSSAPLGWRPGPYVKPGLVMIPVDQAHRYGIAAPASTPAKDVALPDGLDVRSVQSPSEVSALQFNRYADPACPESLMHEAHIVYRRETGPRWRLQPASARQQVLIGPQITDGRGDLKPVVSQELDAFLRQQREHQKDQQELLGKVAAGMKQLAEQQQQLARQVQQLEQGASGAVPGASTAPGAEETDKRVGPTFQP